MTLEAMIFDLDGTLVQTEKLKAISYARAVGDLCLDAVAEAEVVEAFKDVVGLPRQQVARALVERFALESAAFERMDEFGVSTPWQAFIQLRLGHYEAMLADSEVILGNQWPHTIELLELGRAQACKIGLATMSRCPQATRVLEVLNLRDAFDFVATRDDVENGKPDPEIYTLSAKVLNVTPASCLVIEDSPSGVKAALAAGMYCLAVTTPFTRQSIPASGLLDERWIVHDPGRLIDVVDEMKATNFS
jgi:beta-phosphoglucomutase-like phosphatase (HAD superfamily)